MTKKETIIKHWADLNIDTPFGICIETGWYFGFFCNSIDDIKEVYGDDIVELIDFEIGDDGLGEFRPKSLRGIEDNNGWIKIEKVEDLPNNWDTYHVVMQKSGRIVKRDLARGLSKNLDISQVQLYSHYKPINEQDKPLH